MRQEKKSREKESTQKRLWDLYGKVLIVAEKPKAASKIAYALSSNPYRRKIYNIPYYLIRSNGLSIIIASAAGHLYGLSSNRRGYPVFEYEWKPLYLVDRNAKHTYRFIKALDNLCRDTDYYVNACDYDIEGSVIGYLVIKNMGDVNRSFRVKYSSLTREELRKAFNNLEKLDWEMIEAGLCRHELDWIWGINISRALMDAVYKASGKKIVLSAGRVQTPTLKYVVENNIKRNMFIPIPQYSISVVVEKNNKRYTLEYRGPVIETRRKALELVSMIKREKYLIVKKYEEKRTRINPPPAFNLGDLQSEASRIYGFSPYKTQSIAEKLYLDALISYPRTNSQKLPPTLNYRNIMEKLKTIPSYRELVNQLLLETHGVLKPVQGAKEDPAHPAIYPTGVKPYRLSEDEWKIYDLILRRFLATFASPATIIYKSVILVYPRDKELMFHGNGRKIVSRGWFKYYIYSAVEEKYLPKFREGEEVLVVDTKIKRTYTKPPEKISKIKILKWMEKEGIGTEATRARIIEILFKRGYIRNVGGNSVVTDIGFGVIEVLDQYFPELTSVKLTRYFENEMELIRKGLKKREEVVRQARETILKLLKEFEDKKDMLGEKLSIRLGYVKPRHKCMICDREEYKDHLCRYHLQALEELKKNYETWRDREDVSWKQYIMQIKKLRSTGKWVKEVIEHIDGITI